MKVEDKLLIDAETYMAFPEILDNTKNTVFLMPYAQLVTLQECVQETLDDRKASKKEKEAIINKYVPFLNLMADFPQLMSQIIDEKRTESDYVCVNKVTNTFFGYTNYYEENKFNLPKEVVDNDFEFNMITASIDLDCPIYTVNADLIYLIKKYKLPVKFITVPIEQL